MRAVKGKLEKQFDLYFFNGWKIFPAVTPPHSSSALYVSRSLDTLEYTKVSRRKSFADFYSIISSDELFSPPQQQQSNSNNSQHKRQDDKVQESFNDYKVSSTFHIFLCVFFSSAFSIVRERAYLAGNVFFTLLIIIV